MLNSTSTPNSTDTRQYQYLAAPEVPKRKGNSWWVRYVFIYLLVKFSFPFVFVCWRQGDLELLISISLELVTATTLSSSEFLKKIFFISIFMWSVYVHVQKGVCMCVCKQRPEADIRGLFSIAPPLYFFNIYLCVCVHVMGVCLFVHEGVHMLHCACVGPRTALSGCPSTLFVRERLSWLPLCGTLQLPGASLVSTSRPWEYWDYRHSPAHLAFRGSRDLNSICEAFLASLVTCWTITWLSTFHWT